MREVSPPATFARRYRRACAAYLASGAPADLASAYELSHEAIDREVSLLELAEAHRATIAESVLSERDPLRRHQLAERASEFLREALATFESARRGYLAAQELARAEHAHAHQLQSIAEVSVALDAALPIADIVELVTAEARHLLGATHARARLALPGVANPEPIRACSGPAPPRGARPLRAALRGRDGVVAGELELFGVDRSATDAQATLTQLAQVASAAIANAQVYGLEREIAETLQRSLLPRRLPQVEGLEIAARHCPAGDGMVVGGDFYDVFATHGTAVGIVIGDVCGKGPAAAALTALARYTLRAATLWEPRPERVMAILNAAILEQDTDHRFCTAIYGQLRRMSDGGARLDFVACGHPRPLVRRADGRVERVGTHSTVLGVVPDPDLHVNTVTLAPGDVLALVTDGVVEIRRDGREVFGLAQLRALLAELDGVSAGGVAQRIEEAVLRAADGPPRDDVAVVAIRIPD